MSAGSSFSMLCRNVVTKQLGRSHGPATIETAEPGRQGASTRVAGHTHVLGIHLGARQQVIQRADAIPGSPHAEELAHQKLLVPGVQMFRDSHADA